MEHPGSVARQVSFGGLTCLVLFFRTLVVEPLAQWPRCSRDRSVATTVEGGDQHGGLGLYDKNDCQ